MRFARDGSAIPGFYYSAQMLLMLLLLSEHASIAALSIAAASLRVMERSARKPEG